jgi:hypothetical protein
MNTVRVTQRLQSLAAVGVCFALTSLMGCGGGNPKAALKGTVTYKGAPVTGGTLMLYPASGAPFSISLKTDGSFQVDDAPVGPMKVTVETDSVSHAAPGGMPPGMAMPKDSKPPPDMPKPDATNQPKKVVIPAKYNKAETSGLTWDTKAEKTKTFDLTD